MKAGAKALFLLGPVIAPLLWERSPCPEIEIKAEWPALIIAGLLVGVGTVQLRPESGRGTAQDLDCQPARSCNVVLCSPVLQRCTPFVMWWEQKMIKLSAFCRTDLRLQASSGRYGEPRRVLAFLDGRGLGSRHSPW